MSWTYAAFEEESTDAARLTMLNQHITEVRNKISADVSGAEFSRSSGTLRQYLADLYRRREELEAKTGSTNRVGRLAFKRAYS